MLVQECIAFYKCRILDFFLAHKFGPGESPRQAPSMRFTLLLWLGTCSTSDTFTLPVTTKQDLRPYVPNLPIVIRPMMFRLFIANANGTFFGMSESLEASTRR